MVFVCVFLNYCQQQQDILCVVIYKQLISTYFYRLLQVNLHGLAEADHVLRSIYQSQQHIIKNWSKILRSACGAVYSVDWTKFGEVFSFLLNFPESCSSPTNARIWKIFLKMMMSYGRTGRFHGNRYRFSLKLPYLKNDWWYKAKFYTKITRRPMFISVLNRKFVLFCSEKKLQAKNCNLSHCYSQHSQLFTTRL